jgi:hypothetical protein
LDISVTQQIFHNNKGAKSTTLVASKDGYKLRADVTKRAKEINITSPDC